MKKKKYNVFTNVAFMVNRAWHSSRRAVPTCLTLAVQTVGGAVAQMLVAAGNRLFYHTWRSATSNHNYEVDFLLSRGSKLCPIEVKSSGYKMHKSLDEFCKKFSTYIGNRYLIYTKDLHKDGMTQLVPVYMTGLL